jgi:hypothetical protein
MVNKSSFISFLAPYELTKVEETNGSTTMTRKDEPQAFAEENQTSQSDAS